MVVKNIVKSNVRIDIYEFMPLIFDYETVYEYSFVFESNNLNLKKSPVLGHK